jgi:adenylosuccinate lyase
VAAAKVVKQEGGDNDLLSRILADKQFGLSEEELDKLLDVRSFSGMAAKQVEEYISDIVDPLLEKNKDYIGKGNEITV